MNREALVVGINLYPFLKDPLGKPQHLQRAAADAVALAKMLKEHGGFQVYLALEADPADGSLPVDRDLISDISPNREDLEEAIGRLFNPPSEIPGEGNDTALLFFAGHGLVKEAGGVREGFLATSDANGKDRWGLSFNWLRQVLLKSKVRQKLVWLDCCYSGELLNFDEAYPGKLGRDKDTCLIAASRSFEAAEELAGEHGLLTRALLEELDQKKRKESRVTNYSLVDYVTQKLRTTRQRPVYRNFGSEIVITGEKEQVRRATLITEVCPYKGLESFGFNDEDPKYFYGRTALVDEMLDRLRERNFLAVVGASGSGKSSAVQAGLLHQLQLGQRLSGSDEWKIVIFRPGKHPLESLVRAFGGAPEQFDFSDGLNLAQLVRITGYPEVVLVADQFEEAFTLCEDLKLREWFFACLLRALEKPRTNLRVIITMRSDFFGKCTEQDYSGLAKKIQNNLVTVTPMSRDDLQEAIEKPAWKVGLDVPRDLVERMLSDVEEQPGSLPLLQYTLQELWKNHEGNCLTLAAYTKLGGVKGTLEKRADQVYDNLPKEQQSAAKRLFLELTQLGEGTEDTRRQVYTKDLVNEYNFKQ
ncbi:MAG: caspase family protein [Hormoscilla sp. GM7CHS1pb]|nr:caspase family protein [Hormoscilla sp. GM7CHS1pb]